MLENKNEQTNNIIFPFFLFQSSAQKSGLEGLKSHHTATFF